MDKSNKNSFKISAGKKYNQRLTKGEKKALKNARQLRKNRGTLWVELVEA